MARKKQPPVSAEDKQIVGTMLRDLRRAAGYRSVETASTRDGCPASRQTIYAYERGGLVPSLAQLLELIEFYTLDGSSRGGGSSPSGTKPEEDLRAQAVAAVTRALTLPAYHVPAAWDLISRLQPGSHQSRPSRRAARERP